MKWLLLVVVLLSIFSLAVTSDCCKVQSNCYDADATECASIGSNYDVTDCEINNPAMSWADLSCEPFYSPVGSGLMIFLKILLAALLIYIIFKLTWKYYGDEGKKKIKKKVRKKKAKISKKGKKK